MARGSAAPRTRWLSAALGSLAALVACDLAQVAARVATYPSLLRWPGAGGYIAEPVASLAGYALVIVTLALVVRRVPALGNALWVGTVVGATGGLLEIVDISIESLLSLPQQTVSVVTFAAMVTLFMIFGVAGFVGASRARSFWMGVAAAIWSAMVAIMIAVTFGFLLINVALPQLARGMLGDPDYARSGWADPAAFAIANTFDNGLIHLLEAPIIATVLGSVGAGAALRMGWRRRA